MKPPARALLLTILTLTLTAAGLAHAHNDTSPSDTTPWPEPGTTTQDILDAYAWSTQRTDTTIAPLISATAHLGWTPHLLDAYHTAHSDAQQRLTTITQHDLNTTLLTLATTHHPQQPLTTHHLRTDELPSPYIAPLATLLEHQLQPPPHAITPTNDAWTNAKNLATNAAHTLGTIDATLPHLHHAADTTHIDETLPLDPYGLIILGSHNNDTYNTHTITQIEGHNITWAGPLFMIEPNGNETYNVPIAASSSLGTPTIPPFGWTGFTIDATTISIDFNGNDTYNHLTATAQHGKNIKILLSEGDGNDRFGTLSRSNNVASADNGFAYLVSKGGNDTFHAARESIAHAESELHLTSAPAIAVLANYDGNNTYQSDSIFTHARVMNNGAIAHLRDYQGNDTYETSGGAFALSGDDGHATFWDDEGDDAYILESRCSDFGHRFQSAGGLTNRPTDRGFAYFLDGNGTDTHEWEEIAGFCEPPRPFPVEDNHYRVNDRPTHTYGIFTDCETPHNATTPCPKEQKETLNTILENETQPPTLPNP